MQITKTCSLCKQNYTVELSTEEYINCKYSSPKSSYEAEIQRLLLGCICQKCISKKITIDLTTPINSTMGSALCSQDISQK